MSALTINGYAVPVAVDGASLSPEDLGSTDRADSGRLGRTRVALKDQLQIDTRWQRREDAAALLGLVLGRGWRAGFDTGMYTSRGQYPSGSPVVTQRTSEIIAEAVGTEYTHPKLGAGCAAVEAATTNMLTANTAEANDVALFTAIDSATKALETTTYRSGTNCLKVTTLANANAVRGGVQTIAVAAVAATQYAGSVYLRATTGTPHVRVYLRDTVNGTNGTVKTVALSATAWRRVEVMHTTGAGSPFVALFVEEDTVDVAIVFLADQWQIEAHAFATSWTAGASTRAAGSLAYSLGELRAQDDLTVMMWCRRSPLVYDTGDTGRLLTIGDTSNGLYLVSAGGGDSIGVGVIAGGATTSTAIADISAAPVAWHHVALVMRRNPQSGSHRIEAYTDGVLGVDGDADPALPALTAPTLYLGTDSAGANFWNGLIDEVVVLPYGATAAQIAAWYLNEFSDLPKLDVAGDLVAGASTSVEMMGEGGARVTTQGAPGAPTEVGHRLQFKLREV